MEWITSETPVDYDFALQKMDARVAGIASCEAAEAIWLLEHPPLYTAGTSAKETDLLDPRFPVYKTGRGGEYTYHGPGQRVVYAMLDLRRRMAGKPDLKHYIWQLEEWVIRLLADYEIKGERREGRVGIWVAGPGGDQKIAAIGVRIRRWITLHGFALNLDPDLAHYGGIVPCGISDAGVTSIKALGGDPNPALLDQRIKARFRDVF